MYIESNVDYAILQISDLHIFENTEWNIMQQAYKKLPFANKVKCIIITGDLHQYNDNYEKTVLFLNEILEFFNLTKRDIFIVPGNHDAGDCENKESYTCYIDNNIEDNPDCYRPYFLKGKLVDSFSSYNDFIHSFYGEDFKLYSSPEQVSIITWQNRINFIHLNTAINSNGNNKLKQIVDVYGMSNFYETLNRKLPTIMLAHHSIDTIHDSHQSLLTRFITDWRVSAYLCGDAHKVNYRPILTHGSSGSNIPCIVCGKSAPENKDKYSDLGCILYLKSISSSEMEVLPFSWDKKAKNFKQSYIFSNDSGNLKFPLLTEKETVKTIKRIVFYLQWNRYGCLMQKKLKEVRLDLKALLKLIPLINSLMILRLFGEYLL